MTEDIRPIRVLGVPGSLRRDSYNRRLLQAARELAPAGMQIDIHEIGDIPLYNGDLDTDEQRPAAVTRFKQAIAEADAVLIASPEYNHTIPGVLQNAIDWASRPGFQSVLKSKPLGLMTASMGPVGGARAQQQLKLVFMGTLSLVMPHPGVAVGLAGTKFDEQGKLTDQATRDFIADYLRSLQAWTLRNSK